MNKILLGTLLFSLCWPRRPPVLRVRQGEGAAETLIARMPDWLRWITSCQPSIPRRLPGSPRAAEERARHPARLDQGATTAGRRATCASAWKSYQLRITELQIKGGQLGVPTPIDYQCEKSLTLSTAFYSEGQAAAAMINLSGERPSRCSPMRPQRQRLPVRGAKPHPSGPGGDAMLERYGQPPPQLRQDRAADPRPAGAGQPSVGRQQEGSPVGGHSLPFTYAQPSLNPARTPGFRACLIVDLARQFAISSFPFARGPLI